MGWEKLNSHSPLMPGLTAAQRHGSNPARFRTAFQGMPDSCRHPMISLAFQCKLKGFLKRTALLYLAGATSEWSEQCQSSLSQAPGDFSIISVASVPSIGDMSRTKERIWIILLWTPARLPALVWQPYHCYQWQQAFQLWKLVWSLLLLPGGCFWQALCPAT